MAQYVDYRYLKYFSIYGDAEVFDQTKKLLQKKKKIVWSDFFSTLVLC